MVVATGLIKPSDQDSLEEMNWIYNSRGKNTSDNRDSMAAGGRNYKHNKTTSHFLKSKHKTEIENYFKSL